MELEACGHLLPNAVRQIIDSDNAISRADEPLGKIAADKTRHAGYKNFFHALSILAAGHCARPYFNIVYVLVKKTFHFTFLPSELLLAK